MKKEGTRWNSHLKNPSKPLPRSTKPPRKTAVKKKRKPYGKRRRENAARRKERFNGAFGEGGRKAEFVRSLPCVVWQYHRPGLHHVADECAGEVQAAHAKSRGAGGTGEDLFPACQKHHGEQHTTGRFSFESKYGISLTMAADFYEALYRASPSDSLSS